VLVVEAREVDRPWRAQVVDDCRLVVGARKERLPAEQVLRRVEVAGCDRGQRGCRDPTEELRAVEQLEAVRERAKPGVA